MSELESVETERGDLQEQLKLVLRRESEAVVRHDAKMAEVEAILHSVNVARENLIFEREALQVKLRDALLQRNQAVAALREMVDTYGAGHDGDCPEDDTCNCSLKPANDRINAACLLSDDGR